LIHLWSNSFGVSQRHGAVRRGCEGAQYPGISFEFDLTPRQVDLVSEPIDVVIRMGEPANSNLIARKLASLRRGLYASPRYLEQYGDPVQPSDLTHHECLRLRGTRAERWILSSSEGQEEVEVGGRFELNSVGMIRRLATLDLGVALLAEGIVAQDLADGTLRRVLPLWQASPVSVYALTETRLLPAKTQRFIEFLREKLQDA
jgi:DNA-binding transcriptional LysR family regulator